MSMTSRRSTAKARTSSQAKPSPAMTKPNLLVTHGKSAKVVK
ncbi:MAG: hypothetical protein ACLUNV_04080 [Sutterella wadsworthensis]